MATSDRKKPADADVPGAVSSRAEKHFVSRPGRPTREQDKAISRTIMTAATEIFLAQGFDATTMEAVAERAGVPRSTLYKRHRDKTALLREVVTSRVNEWSQMNPITMLTDQLGQRLEQIMTWMILWATTSEVRAVTELAGSAWKEEKDLNLKQEIIGYSRMLKILESEISIFGPASGVVAKRPDHVAHMLMALVAGYLSLRYAPEPASAEEAAQFAKSALDICMLGTVVW